ncbi:uncharacterized protein LOC109517430 [Hippocampus comes]|uniref:uncharacterized protein LOC109517430 n=1 Tax=Hippocampus comes TaxID=109280 RepID=UPI00094EF4C1|nr:PREDICTED: uncharacterized protein LOC109517430 [Hippocampus comes]
MGSGTSRVTKVAPVGFGEAKPAKNVSSSVASSKRDAFDALRVHSRRRAPVDCHSAGHDSGLSGDDDDDADAELGGFDEAGAAVRPKGKKNQAASKKAFMRCRTYGLCHFRTGEEDEQQEQGASSTSSTPSSTTSGLGGAQGPHGSRGAGNKNRSHHAFAPPPQCSTQAFLTRRPTEEDGALSQTQATFGHSMPPLATPVILYDGSEEELMDTIEREFS